MNRDLDVVDELIFQSGLTFAGEEEVKKARCLLVNIQPDTDGSFHHLHYGGSGVVTEKHPERDMLVYYGGYRADIFFLVMFPRHPISGEMGPFYSIETCWDHSSVVLELDETGVSLSDSPEGASFFKVIEGRGQKLF